MILGGILTEFNMLNKDEMLQIIEIMLLRNGFRTHRYNRYHAAVSDQNKQDAPNEDNMKVPILEPKLENVLKNSAIQFMQNKKKRTDKVMTKGNSKTTHNRSKLFFKCELCTFKVFKLSQLKQYIIINTK